MSIKITYDKLIAKIPNKYLLTNYLSKKVSQKIRESFDEGIVTDREVVLRDVLIELISLKSSSKILKKLEGK